MTVRAFTTSDILDTATGALATGTFGTQAVIVKRAATGAWHTFLALHNSGGSALSQFAYNSADQAAWWIDGTTVTGPAAFGTTVWGLLVVRKATGTATPRFSMYNFTTDAWTHANASGTRPNWTAPGASGTVRFRWETFDQFAGRVAVRAAWNSLPWSADTTGDAALEAAGLETSLQNWVDASPTALWAFDQEAVTTDVTDLTGGGADQTARTGTTVVTTDDPPGFSFTLGGTDITGTATGSAGGAGSAGGIRERVAVAAGAGGGTGSAVGSPEPAEVTGTATGAGGGAGAATGTRERVGAASGAGGGVGAAVGAPEASDATGTAQGAGGGAGSATGVRERVGVATGSAGGAGLATGTQEGSVAGTAAGAGGGGGSAIGVRERVAAAVGVAGGIGAAAGVTETVGVATGDGGGVGLVVVLPPVTRGRSAFLARTGPEASPTNRGAANGGLLDRATSSARGGT